MYILLKIIAVILLADFVTGLVHWLEDSYWSPDTPILGKWIVTANLAHHKDGQAFLQKSWWESSWDLFFFGSAVILIALALHRLTWEVMLFVIISVNANQIHKWAHMSDRNKNKPKIISFLQKIYLLQTSMHHGQHHRKPNNSHYCTVTNFLNPLLDKIKFWRFLEFCLTGVSVKNK
jgi:hypothetical protein